MTNLTDIPVSGPVIDYIEAVYSAMLDPALRDEVRKYLRKTCPECERSVDLMTVDQLTDHRTIDGNVIVACEDYWVVNPNIVGIDCPGWSYGCDHNDINPDAKVCRDCGQPVTDEQADAWSERRAGCYS